jgi:hypothetical protein
MTMPFKVRFYNCSEHMGWFRNVVLMSIYLDLENPGRSGFWVGGHMG